MAIKPLGSRVLVRRMKAEEISAGGIIIPDYAKEKPSEGEVIAVGSGTRVGSDCFPVDVKPGDHILFGKYSGEETKVDGDDLLIIREDDIHCVLTKE